MIVDSLVNCNVRISLCVTENKNENNVPSMFYTPNQQDFVQIINLTDGMNQELVPGMVDFKMSSLKGQELTKSDGRYFPMVISINYSLNGIAMAFISYFVFTKDGKEKPNGARNIKQLIIVNGMPFEIKSIFGLEAATKNPSDDAG